MELWKLTCFYAENYSGWSGKMRVPFTSSLQGYFDIWWEKETNVKCNPFFSFPWKIPKVFGKCKTLSNSNVENWLSDNWNFMSETLVSKFLTGQFWMRWLFTKKNVFYLRQGAFIIYKVKPEIGAGKLVALLAPFGKPQWHGLPIEKRRWKFSIPVGLSSYISCGHSGHAEFYSFFQLDPAYWSRPVDRTLDLWLWSDAVGCRSICIELPT